VYGKQNGIWSFGFSQNIKARIQDLHPTLLMIGEDTNEYDDNNIIKAPPFSSLPRQKVGLASPPANLVQTPPHHQSAVTTSLLD
jgi:hypothetical protein